MHTTINGGTNGRGEQIDWTLEIWQQWQRRVLDVIQRNRLPDDERPPMAIVSANYFTPRPAVDAYNRGSAHYGFTWTRADKQVFQTTWTTSD